MPKSPPKPCNKSGCKEYRTSGAYCDKHSHLSSNWTRAKTSKERGYGWEWQKIRKQRLVIDSYLCQICEGNGIMRPATQVDHIINKAQGGSDSLDNLQSICESCHKQKTARESQRALRGWAG